MYGLMITIHTPFSFVYIKLLRIDEIFLVFSILSTKILVYLRNRN